MKETEVIDTFELRLGFKVLRQAVFSFAEDFDPFLYLFL
jgi:hypothetical protein